MHIIGQTANIMMTLNGMRALLTLTSRLNHVRIDGSLRKPLCILNLTRLALKDLYEFFTDNFALGFRVSNTCKLRHKFLFSIDSNHFDTEIAGKHFHDHVAFVQAK